MSEPRDQRERETGRTPVGLDLMPGPCIVCGVTNYPPSVGGPALCPPCDVGVPGQPTAIRIQRSEILRLRSEREGLLEALRVAESYYARLPPFPDRGHDIPAELAQIRAALSRAKGEHE